MSIFHLKTNYRPTGDQPQAIKALLKNLNLGLHDQVLLGITGSGKTFTIANVIEQFSKPVLIISHNKTLAAQLFQEFREFFPANAVHYFVSYYDYYQPEAYLPATDIYIDKDAKINDEIDKLRHATTQSVMTRRDVIVVASVSCLYGLGSPEDYSEVALKIKKGEVILQKEIIRALVEMQYNRTRLTGERGKFRVMGDALHIYPVSSNESYRIDWEENKVINIEIEPHQFKQDNFSGYLSGVLKKKKLNQLRIFPAKHFVAPQGRINLVMANIHAELTDRLAYLERQGKLVESQRLKERTEYDLEMMASTGYCHGIENYSRHLDFRAPGKPPSTLIDYFNHRYGKNGWLLVIDESHITLPQIRGMFEGDQARKKILVKHGFRLPSALDNRPLNFKEFNQRQPKTIYASATPGAYEIDKATHGRYHKLSYANKNLQEDYLGIYGIIEQIIRPTGLLDPKIEIRPIHPGKGDNQIEDLIKELSREVVQGGRALVTTLTKRLAEDIAQHLEAKNFKVVYLHSEVHTLDRSDILKSLRKGKIDIVVGINLLREGLDLPEVSLVAILDADKEGFLRNETSLIQTIGRAARHPKGRVILYADRLTGSIKKAISETERRRKIQEAYNQKHNLVPRKIKKAIRQDVIERKNKNQNLSMPPDLANKRAIIAYLKKEMRRAANAYDFERAAYFRDKYRSLEKTLHETDRKK